MQIKICFKNLRLTSKWVENVIIKWTLYEKSAYLRYLSTKN